MTFERSTLSPTRKPTRKIVAAISTQTGQRGAPGVPRFVVPIQIPRSHDPDEARVEERHRREDVAVVEVPERRRRREEEEQVEVAERERPLPVAEPEQEDEAERSPDPRVVDRGAAERAGRAARHPPRDLRAGPRLGHRAGRVEDRCPPRSRRRRPHQILIVHCWPALVVRLVVRPPLDRIPRQPGGDLRVRSKMWSASSRVCCWPPSCFGTNGVWMSRPWSS